MDFDLLLRLAGLMAASIVAAVSALWFLSLLNKRQAVAPIGFMARPDQAAVFLFEDANLIDATNSARHLLTSTPDNQSDWNRMRGLVIKRFAGFDAEIADLPERGLIEFTEADGKARLCAEWQNGLVRIALENGTPDSNEVGVDSNEFRAMQQEAETLRATAEAAPFLVWRQDECGTITWANNAYLELSGRSDPDSKVPTWPPARLFVPSQLKNMDNAPRSQRVTTHIPAEAEPRWFECFESPLGDGHLFTAVSADKIVRAEVSLRDFVQTLTKTFAHLKIGLAIFDKQRKLALFNPALTDLTSLPADFLSGRPTLQAVLDQLREKRMIPEQRDYKSWRQQLFELETAAQNGTYEETWSLATGRTYRVTGHPHPDGALAFLMEDISAEISLTRRFRMELETGQAVIDSLEEAIAVFSPSGTLTLSNAPYARLWGVEPSETIGNSDIIAATRCWSGKCAPTPVWGDARDFVGALGERAEWIADVRLSDGRNLSCRFSPLQGGGSLAGFTFAQAAITRPPEQQKTAIPMALDQITV